MQTSKTLTRTCSAFVAVTVTLAAAACSSSSNRDSNGSGSGGSIKIGMISGSGPGTPGADLTIVPGANAAVDAINAAGGVNGHRLELTFCDTKGDANKAGACATKMASDSSILATVGNYNFTGGTQIIPALKHGGLAAIATHLVVAAEFDDPEIFPMQAGVLATGAGAFTLMAARGKKRLVGISLQAAGSLGFIDFARKKILPNYPGAQMLDPVLVPPGTSDVTSLAASAIRQNPDGIFVGIANLTVPFVHALRSQGYNGLIDIPGTNTNPTTLKRLGSEAGELIFNASLSHEGAGWDQFHQDLAKYEATAAANVTDAGLNAWMGVHLFADVVAKIPAPVTRAKVVSALNALSSYDTKGLTPTLDFTKPNAVQGYSREFNPYVVGLEFVNGVARNMKPAVEINLFTGKPANG
jgi:branched-chain amino acid transport system substrate-binding protein